MVSVGESYCLYYVLHLTLICYETLILPPSTKKSPMGGRHGFQREIGKVRERIRKVGKV